MTSRMQGRAAIVSGAASGIGRATARRLRAEGADVALLDLRPDPLAVVAAELGGHAIACDVADQAAVARAIHECGERLGRPADVLVNAAGIYQAKPLLDLEPDAWDEMHRVNAGGTLACARAFARALVAVGQPGAIVNVSSISALVAGVGAPAGHYAASKAAVLALTRQMAAEWAVHGIRANAVCPGVIDTPMLRLTDDPAAAAAYLDARVPLHRLGTAEEVAAVICFLASDDAAYVTGCALPVDGGSTVL